MSLFIVSFQNFLLLNSQAKILRQGIRIFSSFKSYDYFREGNAYFIKTWQTQTRQVIKICPKGFLEKGVKKTYSDVDHILLLKSN